MKYNNYLFDLDGTLIDTTEMIYQCFVNTLNVFEIEGYTRENIISKIGKPLRWQMEIFFGSMSDKEYQEILDVLLKYQFKIYRNYLKLFSGVSEVLRILKDNGKKLGIVTSRKRVSAQMFSEEMGIYKYFDVFITPEDTKNHKPDKEPILEAIHLLGGDTNSVFVGDAVFDIQSGYSAGIDTVFVRLSHTDIKNLKINPTFIINDMKDLLKI